MLYPLKFKPILKQTLWGGNRLAFKSDEIKTSIGESWEISAVQDDVSVVIEGPLKNNTLEELISIYMEELVGDKIYEQFGDEFPLLIKYIDACDDLSIQVHPDDTTAKVRHKAYGKTEMWYVVHAEPGAQLILGFDKKVDKSEFLTRLHQNTLLDIMHVEKVKTGDCFFIPAGLVHAIGKGCYIAEIQQTSDITYRIYDYNRRDKNGNLRELHTDLAVDVTDFSYQRKHTIDYSRIKNQTIELIRCDYFTTNKLVFDKEIEKDYFNIDSFVIYMCLTGEFSISYHDHKSIKVSKGDTVLIPANLKHIFLEPEKETEILEIYIDKKT